MGYLGAGARDPNVLVGFDTADDAGVYRLTDEIALVQTVDFITPVVDDPFVFGQVAAANSLSDVYAMGGRPLTALNVCCFPAKGVSRRDLARILEGARERVRAAGAEVVGGHSVTDSELKFGLSVTGVVHPRRILTNAGARPGDRLVLTKPLGTGVIIGALRKQRAVPAELLARCLGWMISLNDAAARAALDHDAHAATDVTGFGLAGHAYEVARASGVGLEFRFDAIPRYEEALELIASGITTANTRINRETLGADFENAGGLSREEETLLFDPQTSGGLLLSLPPERTESCARALHEAGDTLAAVVGEVVAGTRPTIRVLR